MAPQAQEHDQTQEKTSSSFFLLLKHYQENKNFLRVY